MRKEELEHLVTTGMMEGKCSRGKQCEKILDGLPKWLKVRRVKEALKVTKDRDTWKVMIVWAKAHGT